jgi:hypothetical protein
VPGSFESVKVNVTHWLVGDSGELGVKIPGKTGERNGYKAASEENKIMHGLVMKKTVIGSGPVRLPG